MKKRIISFLLAVLLLIGVLPFGVMASLVQNDPAYNEAVLEALQEVVGSEEEAEKYYDLLRQYNLLDEDGNAVTC